jgi:tRNA G37 N-methylase Trm5
MSEELTVFLGALQSLLAWFQKNRGVKDEQKTLALNAINKALIASKQYIEEVAVNGTQNRTREFELAELWADASTKARHASSELASRLNDKSVYWSEPLKWSREEILLKKIDFESVQREVKGLLKAP